MSHRGALRWLIVIAVLPLAIWVGSRSTSFQTMAGLAILGLAIFVFAFNKPELSVVLFFSLVPFVPLYFAIQLPLLQGTFLATLFGLMVLGGATLRRLLTQPRSLVNPFTALVAAKGVQANILWYTLVSGFSFTSGLRAIIGASGLWYLPGIAATLFGRDRRWVRLLIAGIVLAATAQALLAILEALTGFNIMVYLVDHLSFLNRFVSDSLRDTLYSRMERAGMYRVKGTFNQTIDLGWYFGLVLLLAIGTWGYWLPRLSAVYRRAMVGLMVAGLLATVSGTPLIATAAGIAVLAITLPGSGRGRLLAMLVAIVAAFLVLPALFPDLGSIRQVVEAFFQVENDYFFDEGIGPNSAGRLQAYSALWPFIMEDPIWGKGYMLNTDATFLFRDITSRYLVELIEGGFIGLFFFFLPVALALGRAIFAWFATDDPWVKALSATLIAITVQCLVMDGLKNGGGVVEVYFWMTLGLAYALPLSAPKSARVPVDHRLAPPIPTVAGNPARRGAS